MKTKVTLFLFLLLSFSSFAQDKTVNKIIELGQTDNRVMAHDDFLSNVIGGRIVGSHNLEDAEKWVEKQFRSWGLDVVVQEVGQIGVGFSRGPWSGKMLSEDGMVLHFGTPSYTAGTKGPQKGPVVLEPRTRQQFERMKGTLKGAWVLVGGRSNGFALDCTPRADSLRKQVLAENEEIENKNREIMYYNFEHRDAPKKMLPYKDMPALLYREMVEAGVLGFIQASELPMQLHYDRANCYNLTMETLPTVCDIKLDAAQYEIIRKKVEARQEVELLFDIRNHFFEGPVKYHNVLGILKGSKYPDEYVICGGHLDAYDSATGAVDDGQGVSVTMEAARLLTAAGAKPKRSIMFAVWTGEEYGLLGSKYFVQSGMVPMEKVSNYFNRDGGPEVTVSVTVPEAMYGDFVEVCKPLENLNPEFPFSVNKRMERPRPRPTREGGSDHAYFAMSGVPTISFREEDVKGYNFNYRDIWHTDLDLFNKVYPDYLEHSALVNAVVLYGVANLNHMLDRTGLYKEFSLELQKTAPALCKGARKRLVCMDLDATLTQHRTPLSEEAKAALDRLGKRYSLVMVGGGGAERIHNQMNGYPIDILGNYGMEEARVKDGEWKIVRNDNCPVDTAFVLEKCKYFREKYGYTKYYGDPVEFHSSGMVTFGLLGTAAPLDEKLKFDPDRKKRLKMYKEMCEVFNDYSVFIGGSTSFDLTEKQYNKYDAVMRFAKENGYRPDEIIFIGDDFDEGGNDSHIRLGGLDYIRVYDYRDFPQLIEPLL